MEKSLLIILCVWSRFLYIWVGRGLLVVGFSVCLRFTIKPSSLRVVCTSVTRAGMWLLQFTLAVGGKQYGHCTCLIYCFKLTGEVWELYLILSL